MGAPEYLITPANKIYALTHSDAVADPNGPFRGLMVTIAGTIKVTMHGGNTVTLLSGTLAPGVIHPVRFSRVWSTGTTATGLFGVRED